MLSKDNITYRPNACKPVFKFDVTGHPVHTYLRISDAIKEEHINYVRMRELIATGNIFNGHYFSFFSNKENIPIEMIPPDSMSKDIQMPWEGDNGMFNIAGWGKVCF